MPRDEYDGGGEQPSVVLHPGPFLRRALADESSRLGVSVEEIVTFAVLYYLADLDAQRVARRIRGADSDLDRQLEPDPPASPPRR